MRVPLVLADHRVVGGRLPAGARGEDAVLQPAVEHDDARLLPVRGQERVAVLLVLLGVLDDAGELTTLHVLLERGHQRARFRLGQEQRPTGERVGETAREDGRVDLHLLLPKLFPEIHAEGVTELRLRRLERGPLLHSGARAARAYEGDRDEDKGGRAHGAVHLLETRRRSRRRKKRRRQLGADAGPGTTPTA